MKRYSLEKCEFNPVNAWMLFMAAVYGTVTSVEAIFPKSFFYIHTLEIFKKNDSMKNKSIKIDSTKIDSIKNY